MKEKNTIIVTGGAGFIGRCMVHSLLERGYNVHVFDNLVTSLEGSLNGVPFTRVDLSDSLATAAAFAEVGSCQGLIHFAALALVSESCRDPFEYFRNNFMSTLNIAEQCVEHEIQNVVYSSSCAVYGQPESAVLSESHPKKPYSPYGESKWMGEQILQQYARWKKLKVICLRYFNPAGACKEGLFGELHEPETHLLPNVVKAAKMGSTFSVYGDDYPTEDGSCVRDLIHVADLTEAHFAALKKLSLGDVSFAAFNLGTGQGVSVKEVLAAAQRVLGVPIKSKIEKARAGDPPVLVADPTLANKELAWKATRSLDEMILDHHRFLIRQSGKSE